MRRRRRQSSLLPGDATSPANYDKRECRVSLVVPILTCAAGFLIAPTALQVAEKLRARPRPARILVVGTSSLAERIVREAGNGGGVVVGYVGDGPFPSPDSSGSVFLGPIARLSEI